MPVSTINAYSGPFTANGATVEFPFTFTAPTNSEVTVILRDADGVESVATGYTVSLTDGGGGTVTFGTAPATGNSVLVLMAPDFTQELAFEDGSRWLASPVTEGYDRSAARDQVLLRDIGRAMKVPYGEPEQSLPLATDLVGKYLAGDASGNLVPASGTGADGGLREDVAASTGAGLVGFKQSGTGAATRNAGAKLKDMDLSVTDFGATGDGTTDDLTAIETALAAAVDAGVGLHFPNGAYAHSETLDFSYANLRVTFGNDVTLNHTGTGKAVQFDSGVYVEGDPPSVFGVHFGWNCPPTLQGNINTTDLVYVRGSHHMRVDVRLRDCDVGCRVDFSVLSKFRIRQTVNEGGWTVKQPINGVIVDKRGPPEATTACQFDLIIEGVSGLGLDLVLSQHCDYCGTSEGNGGGGVLIQPNSSNNNFSNFFCEQNGTGPHWDIRSVGNIFLNCTGGGPTNTGENTTLVPGIRNRFLNGKFHAVTEFGFFNNWEQTQLTGTLNQNENRIQNKCYDEAFVELPDNYPSNQLTTFTPKGLWVGQTASGEPLHGYYKDRSGTVHLVGALKSGAGSIFDMPAGFRPGGTIYHQYYSITAGSTGVIAVTSAGELYHASGDTGTVALNGLSYKAEG